MKPCRCCKAEIPKEHKNNGKDYCTNCSRHTIKFRQDCYRKVNFAKKEAERLRKRLAMYE